MIWATPRMRVLLNVDDAAQGLNVRENEIRTRNGSVEGYLAAVDPGNGQSERFAADEVGELRLPGVQDLVLRTPAFSIR